jgi:hypothetical protein
VSCQNNLKQIGLALHAYHDTLHALPPGCSYRNGADPQPHVSWCTRLLPYLEQTRLWEQALYAYSEAPFFLDPPHAGVRDKFLPFFVCPSDGRVRAAHDFGVFQVAFTSYLGVEGTDQTTQDGMLYLDSRVRFADVPDGLSNTLLVGERPPSADLIYGWWYAGWGQAKDGSADMDLAVRERSVHPTFTLCPPDSNLYRAGRISNQCDALHFWSLHIGGGHFLLADGSVRLLAYSADPVLPALATRQGGEVAPLP